jgi:hypothetical protein
MSVKIIRHQDLDVYRKSFSAAMQVFELSKRFPKEETYSLTDQIRRSRSVCSNLAEACVSVVMKQLFVNKLKRFGSKLKRFGSRSLRKLRLGSSFQ